MTSISLRGARSTLGFVKLLAKFVAGYGTFAVSSRTPRFAYDAMRQLFCRTDGRLNDAMAWLSGAVRRPYRLGRCTGVLGTLDEREALRVAEHLRRDGFFVFPTRLAEDVCDRLLAFAQRQPALPYTEQGRASRKLVYDRDRWVSTKYEFEEIDLLGDPDVQRLVADRSMLSVAQAFLGTKPVLDLVSMWWSTAFAREASSQAAQLFHFDMDRLKFIKFFIYLTDVGPDNGPHVYVRGSAARKPAPLRRDARIADEQIARHYPAEAVVELTGPRGTVFAADTRGLHKGKPLRSGERLLLQLEFASDLFGQVYERIRLEAGVSEPLRGAIREHPRTFRRLAR